MIEVKITVGDNNVGSVMINNLSGKMKPAIKRAMQAAASHLRTGMKHTLSGPSHTRDPGNSNPYPGRLSGRLSGSVDFELFNGGMSARIGPGERYAAIHEFGGTINTTVKHTRQSAALLAKLGVWLPPGTKLKIVIPARPYLKPTWEREGKETTEILLGKIALAAKGRK